MRKRPFTVAIPDDALRDLEDRLGHARYASDLANSDWAYGTNLDYLKELVEHWLRKFDWRAQERQMNRFPHFQVAIDGVPIHFIHQPGKGTAPIPLLLSHGWPCTFWDYHKVIGPLTDPAAFGGDPEDAFDVVVPSLPGFVFSTPLTKTGVNHWRTADLWVRLMRDVLGYRQFAAHGNDWGSLVTAQLGHKFAEHVIGVHLTMLSPLPFFGGALPDASYFGPDERGWHERNQGFMQHEIAYAAIQMTRPQSLAYALNDSPVGLCAWMLEKKRIWSDCDGVVERRFSRDDILTDVALYWFTQSMGSAARYYSECVRNPWVPAHDRRPVVEAPTAVAVFPGEVILLPRRWADGYYNLKRWTRMASGGHFPAMEEPDALVDDIRAFFRELRH